MCPIVSDFWLMVYWLLAAAWLLMWTLRGRR